MRFITGLLVLITIIASGPIASAEAISKKIYVASTVGAADISIYIASTVGAADVSIYFPTSPDFS